MGLNVSPARVGCVVEGAADGVEDVGELVGDRDGVAEGASVIRYVQMESRTPASVSQVRLPFGLKNSCVCRSQLPGL